MNPQHNPGEFVALWSTHARRVFAYVLSLVGNWADADDIFQETSATLWEKIDEFQPGTDFGAWACRVAHFKALSYSQSKWRFEPLDQLFFDTVAAESTELADELDARFLALASCLAKLSPPDRALVEMRYKGEQPPQRIAEKLGRSVAGTYRSLRRVHELLFECIQRQLAREERS